MLNKKHLKVLALTAMIPLWSTGCGMMGGEASEEQNRRIAELETRARELEAELQDEKEKLEDAQEQLRQRLIQEAQQQSGGGNSTSGT